MAAMAWAGAGGMSLFCNYRWDNVRHALLTLTTKTLRLVWT